MQVKESRLEALIRLSSIDTDQCIIWPYHKHRKDGRASFNYKRKSMNCARYLIMRSVGRELGRFEWVCHKCDNPSCINPKHLFLGTPYDNIHDMMNKGRGNWKKSEEFKKKMSSIIKNSSAHKMSLRYGERNPAHKLSDADVDDIRSSSVTQDELAIKYSCSQSLISRIINRQRRIENVR